MYYFDFRRWEVETDKAHRIAIRRSLKRDELMAYKLNLQANLCFFCGVAIDMKAHLDHLIPVARGGSNNLSNLVAACRSCNLTKGTGQIEITNESTIKDYLRLINAKERWRKRVLLRRSKGLTIKQPPKRVNLYHVFRADCFRYIGPDDQRHPLDLRRNDVRRR